MRDKTAEKATNRLIDEIIRLRKEQGMSHEVLAEKAGIHRSTVSLIESKKRIPTILTCFKLANALNVSLGKIIDATGRLV